jgi:nucleotide-binding universal stress UspA family protein
MTTTHTSTCVVAATDGSRGGRAAVVYAAQEARTRGLPLEVVTVMPAHLPAGPFPVAPDPSLRHGAHKVLDEALDVARATVPGLDVTTTLLLGSRVDALVHHTSEAALLAVGAPPHGLAERLWTGTTVTGTASRVRCPLVIVPPEPVSDRRLGRIVVGLKSSRHAEHLLGAAFAVARQTQSDLVVVHAWRMVSCYDDAIATRATTPEHVAEMVRTLEDSMIDLRMAYPDVRVQVDVVHGQAAFALVDRSAEADLLLISRPAHGGFVHFLGATARAVIRDATCPIEVVPPIDETLHLEHLEHLDGTAVSVP